MAEAKPQTAPKDAQSGAAGASSSTTLLDGCSAEIPVGNVTRVFDFGQFIELFDPGTGPNPQPQRIVIDPVGSLKVSTQVLRAKMRNDGGAGEADADSTELMRLGGRSLQALLASTDERDAPQVELDELAQVLARGELNVEKIDYLVALSRAQRQVLVSGGELLVDLARRDGAGRRSVLLRLKLDELSITPAQAATLIATKSMTVGEKPALVRVDAPVVSALLDEQPIDTELLDDAGEVRRRLRLSPAVGEPAPGTVEIADLPAFLAAPTAPDERGRPAPLLLDAKQVAALRLGGEATMTVRDGPLRLVVTPAMTLRRAIYHPNGGGVGGGKDIDDEPAGGKGGGSGGGTGGGTGGGKGSGTTGGGSTGSGSTGGSSSGGDTGGFVLVGDMTMMPIVVEWVPTTSAPANADPSKRGIGDLVEPRLPGGRGIPVAVMVPWRQTWTLTGFSRGALLSSLALTPQEEVLIELSTWERRSRSLTQSSETETEQSWESSDTSKDSEETFDELTSKQDFTWQVGGSLDVSYSPGVASIQVSANANVQSTQNVANVARTTASRTQEATQKAAARVRSRRVTTITETIESGSEQRVTRRIRNANLTRTLTFDFFETLAHYEIGLSFVPERLAVVALIENPELRAGPDFTEAMIRQNESTFRNALLEPALADGFAALRMLAAYESAKALVAEQQAAQKRDESVAGTSVPAATQPAEAPDPAAAQAQAVLEVLRQIHAGASTLRSKAGVDDALSRIKADDRGRPVGEDARRGGQYWLYVQCLAARAPAFLDALIALAGENKATLTIESAQRIASAIPAPTSAKSLASINDMTAGEKEDAGLGAAIKRHMAVFWDWGWWTQRCREELLYSPNDAGVGGLTDKLTQALQAWEAKRAEGAFAKDKDVVLQSAEAKQDALSTGDRLEMAFPLDELARARERQAALCGHIAQHPQHYSYALFQALTPAEQVSRILEASGGVLQVGLFEPRVVAMSGSRLAVPLTPLAAGGMTTFLDTLRQSLSESLGDTASRPEQVVLPTPGVNMSSRLGRCTAAESFIEDSRVNDVELGRARVAQAQAEAAAAQAEAQRREMLLKREQLDPFEIGGG